MGNAIEERDNAITGVLVSVVIAMIAFLLSNLHRALDSLVVSIIIGILFRNIFDNRLGLERGISLVIRYAIPIGIASYGTQLTFKGGTFIFWLQALIPLLLLFSLTIVFSRIFGLTQNLRLLLASGLSICGASAIAIVSPLIKAKDEETSIAVISITAVGLIGVLFYPMIMDWFKIPERVFAFLTGATLPMLGQVELVSATAGKAAFMLATQIKLLRIATLGIFIPIIFYLYRKEDGKKLYLPWYIIVFVVSAIAFNLIGYLHSIRGYIEPISRFSLSAGIAAIGLSVNLESIMEIGPKPLIVHLISWIIVVFLVLTAFQYILPNI